MVLALQTDSAPPDLDRSNTRYHSSFDINPPVAGFMTDGFLKPFVSWQPGYRYDRWHLSTEYPP